MKGKHIPHIFSNGVELKFCPKCKSWLPLTVFGKGAKSKDKLYCYCKRCVQIYVKEFKTVNKTIILKRDRGYRATRAKKWMVILNERDLLHCSLCGYNKCFAALDFHHIDPATKEYHISKMFGLAPNKKRIAELDKCLVLCSNCHRELHYKNVEGR